MEEESNSFSTLTINHLGIASGLLKKIGLPEEADHFLKDDGMQYHNVIFE